MNADAIARHAAQHFVSDTTYRRMVEFRDWLISEGVQQPGPVSGEREMAVSEAFLHALRDAEKRLLWLATLQASVAAKRFITEEAMAVHDAHERLFPPIIRAPDGDVE